MIIYRIKFKNGKSYIGQTSNTLEWRKNFHFCHARLYKKTKIQRALNKYNSDEIEWEILEDGIDCENELNKLEKEYIVKFDSLKNGYNLTEGGEGTRGYKWSEESKKRLSNSKKGITHSDETRRKMSESKKGTTSPNKGKFGKKSSMYGKTHSQETKDKMSKSAEIRCKEFKAYNPEGVFLGIFKNMSKFEKDNNLPRGTVRDVIIGRNKHTKGYTFSKIG